ncbi:MAG: TlpA disulfide reductase family protein [Saprospiraceae bacterium]
MNILRFFSFWALSVTLLLASCAKDGGTVIPDQPDDMDMIDDQDDNSDKDLAPEFSIEDVSGGTISSASYEGQNLVIFFFGYNCPPCKSVGPSIESRLNQEFKSNSKFAIIGMDQWDGNKAGVEDFQKTTGVTFPLGIKGSSVASAFKTTYDRLVVVNTDGEVVYRGNSIAANNLDTVVDLVKELLN